MTRPPSCQTISRHAPPSRVRSSITGRVRVCLKSGSSKWQVPRFATQSRQVSASTTLLVMRRVASSRKPSSSVCLQWAARSIGRSGIGRRPGVDGTDVEGALDAVGEGVGSEGGVVEQAEIVAITPTSARVRRVGPRRQGSGRCGFGKGAQPGLESRASALSEIAKFTGVFNGFLG